MARRTKEQAAETAQRILLTAENLFLDHGYDEVSLDQVALAAGVTRGAVYWHFQNKQGLLCSLRNKALIPFQKLVDDISEKNSTASIESLVALVSDLFEHLQTEPRYQALFCAMIRLDLALAEKNEADHRPFREERYMLLVRIFELIEQDSGLPSPWSPRTAASAFNASLSGLTLEWALGQGRLRLAPDGIAIIGALLNLLSPATDG